MKTYKPCLIFLLTLYFTSGYAQLKTQNFELFYPNVAIKNSSYNKIAIIDLRSDTISLGYRVKDFGIKQIPIVPVNPLSSQLNTFFNSIIDTTAKDNKLVFLIRQLFFSQAKGNGYFSFKADLLLETNNQYQQISAIDTLVVVDAMDLTKVMLLNGSNVITSFIIDGMHKTPFDKQPLTTANIMNMDSVRKMRIPLYTVNNYVSGAYKTYEAFKQQIPDDTAINIEFYKKTGNWKSIQLKNKKGKYEEVELRKWYGFAFNNQLFISTTTGVYRLEKKDNDFVFIGEVQKNPGVGAAFATGVMFGLIGGGILYSTQRVKGELVIDYITGKIIKVQ